MSHVVNKEPMPGIKRHEVLVRFGRMPLNRRSVAEHVKGLECQQLIVQVPSAVLVERDQSKTVSLVVFSSNVGCIRTRHLARTFQRRVLEPLRQVQM